jgi:GNAT superfamily N-acetyltransferase
MTDDLCLAPPRAEDRARWAALWRGYLAFYGTTRDAATYDAAFAQLMSGDPQAFHGLLAWRGAEAVGLVHWVWHPHMWRPEGIHYLQDLYVAPEARGTGAGRRLIEAVYDAADAAGASGVYWLTQEGNAVGRRLYDRIGVATDFIRYDRPPAYAA